VHRRVQANRSSALFDVNVRLNFACSQPIRFGAA
jgi:hypothetical protein